MRRPPLHSGAMSEERRQRAVARRITPREADADPDWCLPSRVDQNLLVWLLEVNGLLVDVRHMPREVQEIAYRKGLIPYIPADRQPG